MSEKMRDVGNHANPADPKVTGTVIVIGGLTNLTSLDEASKWIREVLWTAYAPMPVEIYIKRKDGIFSGVFYAKFATPGDRIKGLSVVKNNFVEVGGQGKWANIDLPSDIRAPEAFVTGLKKILLSAEWGFAEGSVWYNIDGPSKYLKVEGKIVLTVSCAEGGLVYEWEEKWKNWGELHGSPEIKTLTEKSTKLISGGGKGEGKAKGK
jgi:hypothetical protein